MEGMLAVPLAKLHEFELFLLGFAILCRRIVAALALGTSKGDDFDVLLLGSHDRSFRRGDQCLRL